LKRLIFLFLFTCSLAACAESSEPESDMVLIPAGAFTLGLNPAEEIPSFVSDRTSSKNAQPQQEVTLEAFYMDIHEVSYGEFLRFKPQARYAEGRLANPMQGVSWFEADAYCLWLGKRLPTETEWEKAARGLEGNLYVWGNEFKRENANFGKTVQPSAKQSQDLSEFGIYDLNGNVSEWTASWYQPYQGSSFKDPNFGKKYKVIRGGAINKREHGFLKEFALLSYRNFAPPKMRSWDTGFRCARSIPPSSKSNS
jgi:formylglycine-generating enzyme required for sulfatase activity